MNKPGLWSSIAALGVFFAASSLVPAQNFHLVVPHTQTGQTSTGTLNLPPGCPDYTGVLSAVGAPVGQPVNL